MDGFGHKGTRNRCSFQYSLTSCTGQFTKTPFVYPLCSRNRHFVYDGCSRNGRERPITCTKKARECTRTLEYRAEKVQQKQGFYCYSAITTAGVRSISSSLASMSRSIRRYSPRGLTKYDDTALRAVLLTMGFHFPPAAR